MRQKARKEQALRIGVDESGTAWIFNLTGDRWPLKMGYICLPEKVKIETKRDTKAES